MRKTRLIVQPRRCLHTVGFLLLFMSCPTYGDWGLVQPESAATQRAISLQGDGARTILKEPPDARITNRHDTESARRTNFEILGKRPEAQNQRMSQDFVRVNTPSGMLRQIKEQSHATRRVERGSAERNYRFLKQEERYRLETPQRRLLRRESLSENRRVIENRRERVHDNRRSAYRLPEEIRTSRAEEREVRRYSPMNSELVNGRRVNKLVGSPSRRHLQIEGNIPVSRRLVRREANDPIKKKDNREPAREERVQARRINLQRNTRELQIERRSFTETRNVFDRVNMREESRGAAKSAERLYEGASVMAREHRGSIIREKRNEKMRVTVAENRAEKGYPRRSVRNLRRDNTSLRMNKRETRRTTEENNNERRKTDILASDGENSRRQKNVQEEHRDMTAKGPRQTRRDVREHRNDNTQTRSRVIPLAREQRAARQIRRVKIDTPAKTVNRDGERRELSQRRENVHITRVGELQRSVFYREKEDVRMDQQVLNVPTERFENRRVQARSQMVTASRKLQDQRRTRQTRSVRRVEENNKQSIVDGERRNRFDDHAEFSKVRKVRDERESVRSENRRLEDRRNTVRSVARDQKIDLKKGMMLTTNQEEQLTKNQEFDDNERKMFPVKPYNLDSVQRMAHDKNENWSSLKKITENCLLGAIAYFITTRNPKIAY